MSTGTVLPRSVPVSPELQPQFVQFERPVRRFVLHNAKPKDHETMFGGNMMTIPACDRVRADKTAYDADGDPIPGTYVVEDVYSFVAEFEDYILTFDAEKAVRHILGIPKQRPSKPGDPPVPVQLTSPHAIRGLSLLPLNASKELWKAVAQSGEHRAFLAAVEDAQETISSYEVAAAKAKEAGMAPRPPRKDYHYAVSLVEQYNKLVNKETEERVSPWRAEAELSAEAEDIELEMEMQLAAEEMRDKLIAEMKEKGLTPPDPTEVFDRLMSNPKVRAYAQKRYRFRKKGHMDLGDIADSPAATGGMPDNLLHPGGEE